MKPNNPQLSNKRYLVPFVLITSLFFLSEAMACVLFVKERERLL